MSPVKPTTVASSTRRNNSAVLDERSSFQFRPISNRYFLLMRVTVAKSKSVAFLIIMLLPWASGPRGVQVLEYPVCDVLERLRPLVPRVGHVHLYYVDYVGRRLGQDDYPV